MKAVPKDCPFCDADIELHEGKWRIVHKDSCWLFIKRWKSQWINNQQELEEWNTRNPLDDDKEFDDDDE